MTITVSRSAVQTTQMFIGSTGIILNVLSQGGSRDRNRGRGVQKWQERLEIFVVSTVAFTQVSTGSSLRDGDAEVYVFDINPPVV